MTLLLLVLTLGCGSRGEPELPRSRATTPTALATPRVMGIEAFPSAPAGLILDVRMPDAYAAGHIPGAVRITDGDVDPLFPPFSSHNPAIPIYVIDDEGGPGGHAALVARKLTAAGFDAVRVEGGFTAWQASGHPVGTGR